MSMQASVGTGTTAEGSGANGAAGTVIGGESSTMGVSAPKQGTPIPGMKQDAAAATKEVADNAAAAANAEEALQDEEAIKKANIAFMKRVDRATQAKMREIATELGLEALDVDTLKQLKATADAAKQKEEEARRAQMTELQKKDEDLKRERDRAAKAEARAQELELNQLKNESREYLKEQGGGLFEPKYWKHVLRDFDEMFEEKSKKEQLAFASDTKQIKQWFTDYAKENPRFVKEASNAQPVAAQKELLRSGADPVKKGNAAPAGAGGANVAPGVAAAGGKNAKQMSDEEWRELKKQKGWT